MPVHPCLAAAKGNMQTAPHGRRKAVAVGILHAVADQAAEIVAEILCGVGSVHAFGIEKTGIKRHNITLLVLYSTLRVSG